MSSYNVSLDNDVLRVGFGTPASNDHIFDISVKSVEAKNIGLVYSSE